MLFQLTSAGRSLINSNPTGVNITRVDFGSDFNYTVSSTPTGLQGTTVYTSNLVFAPAIDTPNTLRYTVLIPYSAGPFNFGEIALYSGSTLFGVGSQPTATVKTVGQPGNDFRIDVFVDLLNGQHFASFEVVSSDTQYYFPRVPSVDALVAPHFDTNNAYVVYGTAQPGEGFMAYSDPTGIWSFSSKPHVWYAGTVNTIGAQGFQSNNLLGVNYNGDVTALVVQFLTGALRGYCRKVVELTTAGGVRWNTDLLDFAKVQQGDEFIINGPQTSVNFGGMHNSLSGLQGGDGPDEFYHLTAQDYLKALHPRLTARNLTGSTYSLVSTDNDCYLTIGSTCTVSMSNPDVTLYPIGGITIFRVVNAVVTFQGISGAQLNPTNPITIDCTGKTVTFAVVRKSTNTWDLVAPQSSLASGSGNGNVQHDYAANPRSSAAFLPMYSDTGSETGPVATLESSRVQSLDAGSLRVYPGDLAQSTDWIAPAQLVWPMEAGIVGSTATGLPNNTTQVGITVLINGTSYVLQVAGSTAQTYNALLTAMNNRALAVLPSSRTLILRMGPGHIVLTATSTLPTTTFQITDGSLFTTLSTLSNPRITATSENDAVDPTALVLDGFDAANKQPRAVGAWSQAVGFRSRVKGLFSAVFGGLFTSIEGNNSVAVGSDGGYIVGDRNTLVGGRANVIAGASEGSSLKPTHAAIVGGSGNRIIDNGAVQPKNSAIVVSDKMLVRGSQSFVAASAQSTAGGDTNTFIGTTNVTADGSNITSIGTSNVTATGVNNLLMVGNKTLTVTARNTAVLFQHDINIVNSASLYYPTESNVTTKGPAGFAFSMHMARQGAGAAMRLTTDSNSDTLTNVMTVQNGHCWMLDGTVSANRGSADFKGWKVTALMFNILGTVTIEGLNIEVLGETFNTTNWDIDLVVDTVNTDRVYFTVNTANITSGLDTVSVSAFVHVNSARPLL